MGRFRTVSNEIMHVLGAEASDSQTTAQNTATAEVIEIWVRVTAISGAITFPVEASVDGTNFSEISATLSASATGIIQKTFSREDFPLGTSLRVLWSLGGGTGTFEIRMIRQER